MDNNQRIFKWLNPDGCWHEWGDPLNARCSICGDLWEIVAIDGFNPFYDTDPAAMLELIEAVRAKGYEDIQMATDRLNGKPHGYYCHIARGLHESICDANAATLPEAVSNAVIALIDSIEQEAK